MERGIENERVLQKLISQMNISSPRRRARLSELLQLERPYYEGRDGRKYHFDKAELLLIREAMKRLDIFDVRLPIVLLADSTTDHPAWRIESEDESRIVSEIIDHRFVRDGRLTLYAAHMSVLRKKLPTTTICIFVP